MKTGRYQWRGGEPDRQTGQGDSGNLPTPPPQPPLPGRPRRGDQPLERIVGTARHQPGAHREQHSRRQERKLRAHRHHCRRGGQQDADRRQGQRPQPTRSPLQPNGEAGEPDEHRCPHHRHLTPDNCCIDGGADGHNRPGCPAGDGQPPQHAQQAGGEQPDVQPRDGQDVNGAGAGKPFHGRPGQRFTAAQQQGSHQRSLGLGHRPLQLSSSSPMEPINHRRWRPPGRRLHQSDARPITNPNQREHSTSLCLFGKVVLPRVKRGPRPKPAAEQPDATAGEQRPTGPIDKDSRLARHRLPPVLMPRGSELELPLTGRGSVAAPGRIRRGRPWAGPAQHNPLNRHGLRPLGEAPGQIIVRKQPNLAPGPAGGGQTDSGQGQQPGGRRIRERPPQLDHQRTGNQWCRQPDQSAGVPGSGNRPVGKHGS